MIGRRSGPSRSRLVKPVAILLSGLAVLAGYGSAAQASPTASGLGRASGPSVTAVTAPPEPLTERELGPVPAGFASWTEVFDLQERMNLAADQIRDAAGAASGLAGIVAAPEARRLTVYWKGEPPPETTGLIGRIGAELPVDVRAARYSATELSDVSQVVATKPGVAMVAGNVDGSGVTATVDGEVDVASWGVGVPVTLRQGERPFPTLCSRQVDCSPWWGGGRYVSSTSVCTMGFAVQSGATKYMISAAHCTAGVGDPITTLGGSVIGWVKSVNNNRDIMLIRHTPGSDFQGVIYAGTYNAISGYHRRVRAALASSVGNYVCTSGSGTAEHCAMKVVAVNLWFASSTGGAPYGPFVQADHVSGGVAVGDGDSGGPVHFGLWYILAGNYHATDALGTIAMAQNQVPCLPNVPSTKCGSTVLYADIKQSLAHYQASIVTEVAGGVTKM
jgi:hypothetical protein